MLRSLVGIWRVPLLLVATLAGSVVMWVAPAAAQVAASTVRIHYHRNLADYAGWQLYTWYGALNPSPQWNPAQPPTSSDDFGVYYDVALNTADSGLNFILHDASGNNKNCPNDMFAPFPASAAQQGFEIWQLQDDCTIYTTAPATKVGNVSMAGAQWLTPSTVAWPGANPNDTYRLYFAAEGGIDTTQSNITGGTSIPLSVRAGGLDAELQAKFPNIATATALALRSSDLGKVPGILKGQIVVTRWHGTTLVDATALQIPGVLDALYTYRGRLGAVILRGGDDGDNQCGGPAGGLVFCVWAPTAKTVNLYVYDSPTATSASVLPMHWNPATGVWALRGDPSWINRKYYKYEARVFVRATGNVETNLVTDPYSLGLSVNSQRSLVVDLESRETMPAGWNRNGVATNASVSNVAARSVYELHVRDFSIADRSVPAADRGKFLAFTHSNSNGMTHLRELARAGLTYVHLMPAFDFATVPEDPHDQIVPVIPNAAPDSTTQQAAIAPVRDRDGFNWGYDPWHYTTPEGSYASDSNGLARIREFRAMVGALHDAGLKVVMDVVYNHTFAAGQDPKSVLDRIVPGYYYRLSDSGAVLSDSCCSDTAAEHAMFEKLMIDSTEVWVRDYGVDAFRFDLMSLHPKDTMLRLRANLQRYAPEMYIYGEGWDFGVVGGNSRFVQASQLNLAGTGLGTLNDRISFAVRGGSPFDNGQWLVFDQGFINGLWYDDNALTAPRTPDQRDELAYMKDLIMLSMAGNLADYMLVDKNGNLNKGSQIDGLPAGYTGRPSENIVYASVHDSQTLFDNNQYKLPVDTSLANRVRTQTLGLSIIALSQGVSFFQAGDDLLRSKSLDGNSYNSGDWFNQLDFTYMSNNFGVGLPPAWAGNDGNWTVMQPFLADPSLKPGFGEIDQARRNFLDFLRIRSSTPLFNLGSAAEVMRRLEFYNTGPAQNPALIVMALAGDKGEGLLVLINVDKSPVSFAPTTNGAADYVGAQARLHEVQRFGADPIVKSSSFDPVSGTFGVPARTTAVFVIRGKDAAN